MANPTLSDNWHTIEELEPKPDDKILVELNGCKVMDYMIMIVREGEGLGHIKRWKKIGINDA
jgi:hypothetical protein